MREEGVVQDAGGAGMWRWKACRGFCERRVMDKGRREWGLGGQCTARCRRSREEDKSKTTKSDKVNSENLRTFGAVDAG